MKELFAKYLSGTATSEERENLLRHLRDDELLAGWLRADIEYTEGNMPEPIRERILRNIYSSASPVRNTYDQAKHRTVVWRRWQVAAVVIAVVALSAALGWSLLRQQPAGTDMPMGDFVVSTGMGEHSHVTLPDGTLLTLNAQTTVRYNLLSGTRHAVVDGEAFFEVARDTLHPFIVQAAQAQVTCLGTAFNVRHYADENNVAVVLVEGKVRVSANEAEVTMEPDSRVLYDCNTRTLSKHSVQSSDYTCWLSGEVKYNNQTLEEIAAELSRNYNIAMVITNDELKHERFTGYLGRSSLRNILDVLCLASDMSYYVDNDTMVYVYPRRKK
ncbi:MAG: FecR domain-containing protein [Paludibacteraceae bacterium]|nr:FecR domain-containing protein [Paludibacteraceae bacterium]